MYSGSLNSVHTSTTRLGAYPVVQSKGEVLIDFLLSYYKTRIDLFNNILTQKTLLSLRLLDWLVTNYSKKYNIIYPILRKGEKEYFNIYLSYKNQLKAYSKKFFDPFCRRDRIIVNINNMTWRKYVNEKKNHDECITTVGQLNFFKWFIENKVLEYAISNIREIDKDMNETLSVKSSKRRELSNSAVKGIYTSPQKITIKFT